MKQFIVMVLLATAVSACFYVAGSSSQEQWMQSVSKSSVQINGNCTGTVIKPGVVLTAYHCVAAVGEKSVFLVRSRDSAVVMYFKAGLAEEAADVALLTGGTIATPAGISESPPIPLRDHVVIGHPWGAVQQVVSMLLYSGIEPTPYGDFDLYSGAVAPGNSGSGIFNRKGEVVGVVLRAPRTNATYLLSITHSKLRSFLKDNGI